MPITHAKVSAKSDGGDSSLVRPSDWNAAHVGSAGSLVLLEQHTASSSAALNFTTFISSTYDTYMFQFIKVVPATNAQQFVAQVGTGGGPTYDTGNNYGYTSFIAVNNATGVSGADAGGGLGLMGSGVSNVSTQGGATGFMYMYDPQSPTDEKSFTGQFNDRATTNGGKVATWTFAGNYYPATALTAIRFLFASGNIASGTIRVYGIEK